MQSCRNDKQIMHDNPHQSPGAVKPLALVKKAFWSGPNILARREFSREELRKPDQEKQKVFNSRPDNTKIPENSRGARSGF